MRTENRFTVYLQIIALTAIFSAVGVLVVMGINSGVLASPGKQVPPIVNNYYGIDCGSSDAPCYIRQVDGETLTVDTKILTDAECPNYPGGSSTFECNKPLNVQTIPNTSVQITTTNPITTVVVPRMVNEYDVTLIVILIAAVFVKLLVAFLIDVFEKNIFVNIYRAATTGIFVLLDIFVIYPATQMSLDYTLYGVVICLWIFLLIVDRAYDFMRHLWR